MSMCVRAESTVAQGGDFKIVPCGGAAAAEVAPREAVFVPQSDDEARREENNRVAWRKDLAEAARNPCPVDLAEVFQLAEVQVHKTAILEAGYNTLPKLLAIGERHLALLEESGVSTAAIGRLRKEIAKRRPRSRSSGKGGKQKQPEAPIDPASNEGVMASLRRVGVSAALAAEVSSKLTAQQLSCSAG